jgi:hypothetical protein
MAREVSHGGKKAWNGGQGRSKRKKRVGKRKGK